MFNNLGSMKETDLLSWIWNHKMEDLFSK